VEYKLRSRALEVRAVNNTTHSTNKQTSKRPPKYPLSSTQSSRLHSLFPRSFETVLPSICYLSNGANTPRFLSCSGRSALRQVWGYICLCRWLGSTGWYVKYKTGFGSQHASYLISTFPDTRRGPPALSFPGTKSDSAYVLLMVDLDAPNHANPIYGPFLHWLVAIPAGQSGLSGSKDDDDESTVAPYVAPNPPLGSGKHRYVFLLMENSSAVFEMPPAFRDLEPSNLMSRTVFDVAKFVADGGFRPVAANWFTTEKPTPEE
jgi:phosphatidylethanolamine-binding protein (PEBP) family uncharacterized protein